MSDPGLRTSKEKVCPVCDWQLPANYHTDSLRVHLTHHNGLEVYEALQRLSHEPFVCPVCKADPCQTVWHDQACDYAPTDDGIAHVGGKGCIPKITRPSPPPGTALQALAKFGAAVIEEARGELGDLDGGWLQDKAVECGVLEPVTALAPCGDECRCAEYDDFPQECFQYPDDVRSALTKGGE
jgi:hypothetical protein